VNGINHSMKFGPFTLWILAVAAPAIGLGQSAPTEFREAISAIATELDRHEIVALPVSHGLQELDDFVLRLVQDARINEKLDDIVFEGGNRRHQALLDRYVMGEALSVDELRPVWRDTTQQMWSLTDLGPRLFTLVRGLNHGRPAGKRLRVLVTEPPIDWSKIQNQSDYLTFRNDRSASITHTIVTEVLAKQRRALLLFGEGHIAHQARTSSVADYEVAYPGKTFVIFVHKGFGNDNPLEAQNASLEKRLTAWSIPSIGLLRGSWLADLELGYYFDVVARSIAGLKIADLADAYLYLGPRDALHRTRIPENILNDQGYLDELNRRPWPARPIDAAAEGRREPAARYYVPVAARPVTKR
jgi:hypothetical protein